jgi:hypothetical protein
MPTAITATISSTPTEIGSNTGTATVTPSGGTPPYTYSWNNLTTAPTTGGLNAGNYCVTITDSNCATQTVCIDVQEIVATSNTTNANISFRLSPNPTSDMIHIKTDLTNYTAILSDLTGKVLLSQQDAKACDLSAFANGTYFITIKNKEGATLTQRIVKR